MRINNDKPFRENKLYPDESKRLIGIKYEDFIVLVTLAEKKHLEKKAEMEERKIRLIAAGGGRKAEMTSAEGVCLCLVYLRQKPTFEILGLLFDVSRTKANNTFNYWVKILREILPASQVEEVKNDDKKYQELCKNLCEYELLVDSAEQAILTTRGLSRAKKILFRQEENAHIKKSIYSIARWSRYSGYLHWTIRENKRYYII
ncbi:helix-turn-helix domain-containing protein [Nostoc sp. 'Peltigera membranacea cyanobiont' 210A]|uniref:helix-turn-helix domain-containing protein n=1 Tax=Nostoc sp. 'Peltigera membranacea cyanobiont' 210A TaxID=2014529 RepID=UPI001CB94AA2|nr:transposase family protein [Nostoc sp. 'Peltigera membranacea cyanobiont' 210A]